MKSNFESQIVSNLVKLLEISNLSKKELADRTEIDQSTVGKILSGKQGLQLYQLEKISKAFGMTELDVITYPVKYKPIERSEREHVTVMIEVTPENKERLFEYINTKI